MEDAFSFSDIETASRGVATPRISMHDILQILVEHLQRLGNFMVALHRELVMVPAQRFAICCPSLEKASANQPQFTPHLASFEHPWAH